MISFSVITEENIESVRESLAENITDTEFLYEVTDSFLALSMDGVEVALSATSGVLLVRIFDEGRYSFVYPILIDDGADVDLALTSIVAYARRELIPVYFTDCPREELDRLGRLFAHVDARAYDDDEDSFVALLNSECDMIDEVPSASSGVITLSEILDEDSLRYAALCRDRKVNEFWGFDDTADVPDATDDYFLTLLRSELARGVALSLAVRLDGEMIGEAVLFDFDYVGGAMAAIRLFADKQGSGYGSMALTALIDIARGIGLKTLRAEVMTENVASIKMTEKQMTHMGVRDGVALFSLDLTADA